LMGNGLDPVLVDSYVKDFMEKALVSRLMVIKLMNNKSKIRESGKSKLYLIPNVVFREMFKYC